MNKMKELLSKYKIRPTKSLGQNFLNDEQAIKRIADSANITEKDLVIEVGPGTGILTSELAKRAGLVVAVEIDRHLIPVLEDQLADFSNINILHEDIMKLNIGKDIIDTVLEKHPSFKPDSIKVVANLPYYITTPVIMKFLEEEIRVDTLVFMVQKEVADRIIASPGGKDYGALSVAVQFYSAPEKVFDVPPHCFIPQPEVYSTVIRLNVHKQPPVDIKDRALFFKTVKAAFGQRRKTLVNALSNSGYFTEDKEKIKEILMNIGIDECQRGETLTVLQFAQLANSFCKKDC